LCHALGIYKMEVPKNWHLWWGDLILSQRIQGGEFPF
jgi:hypothetical protein